MFRFGFRVVFAGFAAMADGMAFAAEQKGGSLDWANRDDGRPVARIAGYLPAASVESQGGDSAKVADWVKALDAVGGLHAFVVLRHGRLVAEGAWAPYGVKRPHSLHGLSGVLSASLMGALAHERGDDAAPVGVELAALTARDPSAALAEARRLRDIVSKKDGMYYEQAVSRHFSVYLGFNWERGATAGDGLGRKTSARDMALVGQLHLWKGEWFGRRLWSEAWAEKYYRFFTRPSGLKVALGERGQILAVDPKADLVLSINGDTAETERVLALTESILLPAFGAKALPENAAASKGLSGLCAGLRLDEVKDSAACTATLGTTYDLPENRYGLSQFRLSKSASGCNLELIRPGCAQVVSVRPAPNRTFCDLTFADAEGGETGVRGRYKVSVTGGWTGPKAYAVRMHLVEASESFDCAIDLADPSAPVFTVVRGAEKGRPLVLKGKRAETVCGVRRVQKRAEIIWTHPIRKAAYIGWPTVMRRRSGELIASYSGNREAHVCPYGREELIRSTDGGETWTPKPEIFFNSIVDDRDCGIIELANGDLLAAWFSSTCFEGCYPKAYAKLPKHLVNAARGKWTRRSTDGGRTWEDPVPHRSSAPHGAVQLKDGRILFAGTAWNRGDTWNPRHYPDGVNCLMIEESTDDGRSWHELARIFPQPPFSAPENVFEPYLAETDDGRLVVFCRSANTPEMTQVESADGGRTWSAMRKTPIVGYPPHFCRTRDGKFLCTYVDRSTLHEMVVISDDQCRTWDVANRIFISKGPKTDMGYPSTVQNDDGTFLTVYYQPETAKEDPCLMATRWRMVK